MRIEAGLGQLVVLRLLRRVRQRAQAQLEAAVVHRRLRENDPDCVALRTGRAVLLAPCADAI